MAGSGNGKGEASMSRQMPYEPLPASVLFALGSVGKLSFMWLKTQTLRLWAKHNP
jgi:hypothetical protein